MQTGVLPPNPSQSELNHSAVDASIMNTKKRKRGLYIDTASLKYFAEKIHIKTIEKFELKLYQVNPDLRKGSKLGRKAWYGTHRIDSRYLEKVARTLELDDYSRLVKESTVEPAWYKLVFNEAYQSHFMNFVDHDVTDLSLIKFEASDDDALQEVSVDTHWHLELRGEKEEAILLLLQSETEFFQLAPIQREGFDPHLTSINTRYPAEENLSFDKSRGVGWRRLIAIKGRFLPIQVKGTETGFACTYDELDLLARNILSRKQEDFAVAVFEFRLIE